MKTYVNGDSMRTYQRRPDLLDNYELTAEEAKMLAEIKEHNN